MKRINYLLIMLISLGGYLHAQDKLIGTGDGLTGEYWKGGTNFNEPEDLAFGRNGAIATYQFTRTDPNIDFSWGDGNPFDNTMVDVPFCVKWTGYIQAQYTGSYNFLQYPWDDGSAIYLWDLEDNLIDKYEDWAPFRFDLEDRKLEDLQLERGQFYRIELRHYENEFSAKAHFQWFCTDIEDEYSIVPQSQLYTKLPESSAIKENSASPIKIYTNKGRIQIEGLNKAVVNVYSCIGNNVYSTTATESNLSIELPQGIYIVKVGDTSTKVVIK